VEYRTVKQPRLNLPAESQIEAPQPLALMTFGDSVALNAELYEMLGQSNIDRAAVRKLMQMINEFN